VIELREGLIAVSYFVSALFFIFGIKWMSSPATARRGNLAASAAMGIAILATFLDPNLARIGLILVALLIGGVGGAVWGRKVAMTGMPQMVALLNGVGGATVALVAVAESLTGEVEGAAIAFSAALGTAIGSLSFGGSVAAWGKLQGVLPDQPLRYPGQMLVNALLLLGGVGLTVAASMSIGGTTGLVAIALTLMLLGVLAVLPIGGADMPVVIAILNSCTGVAAALTGFVFGNQILIVAGALVGASGSFLTVLMARAMNRPISNVLFGAFGSGGAAAGPGAGPGGGTMRATNAEDVATAMAFSREVVIVPGYGLAVAQAQQGVKQLADELTRRGVNVRFAIHPVAGRMPGHMNVVLADADVPYDQLWEMEAINGDFPSTDTVLVIGANDVVNPAAKNDPTSPIYGMPILEVENAKSVVVLKRSTKPGFAGIDNELFYRRNTAMLFGDAKASVTALLTALREN
jgi:NAD(P) transhydrogenase subunit beta